MKSTDDTRVTNNVMRHEYRVLSEEEKELMQKIKDKGLEMYKLIKEVDTVKSTGVNAGESFEVQTACLKIEECVMWAVKGLTK